MTEHEWLTGTVGWDMADFHGKRFTERKARLVALACCLRNTRFFDRDVFKEAVAALEAHYADPRAPDTPFDSPALRELHARVHEAVTGRYGGRASLGWGVNAATEPITIAKKLGESISFLVYSCLKDTARGLEREGITDEAASQAVIVRDVIGNPFQPIALKKTTRQLDGKRVRARVFAPAWRTDTVVSLAEQMYAANEFSATPILADALQDAGCNYEDVLSHCRDTSLVHVRGCWVVDLVLGKQ
jgi:hypothetical protein